MWKYLILVLVIRPACLLHGKGQEGAAITKPTQSATGARRYGGAHDQVFRFTTRTTAKRYYIKRTTAAMVSFKENCDYLAFYCLRAYDTGTVCGMTVNYIYHNFKNYCQLDYVNCMERYNLWQVVHMGECIDVRPITEYAHYAYDDDLFLEQYYLLDDV